MLRASLILLLCPLALASLNLPAQSTSLARHDFLITGESHQRRICIVRNGHIAWSFDDTAAKGEISDAVLLSNGSILYAHQFGITLLSPEKKVLWHYDVPAGHEVHTAVPIGLDRVLYIQNGDPALVRVVNVRSNAVEREFPLATRQPASIHGQFRHARLTAQGTLLVAHMDLNKVVEYDSAGHELWSFPATGAWGVTPLANGNVLITDRVGVREITRRGDAVWAWTPSDNPSVHFVSLQQAWRLPDGNTIINSWANEWTANDENRPGQMQAVEITPDKHVAWILQSWTPPDNLGPVTSLQFTGPRDLEPSAPAAEAVHFGDIR